ncbi:MAG: hypothetical protein JNJ77_01845 [Planctomycetia bacterium]|nr:hypothetical protein [Planctomycetia bacterium]
MASMIACTSCRQALTLPAGIASGTSIRCPACQKVMKYPGSPSNPPLAKPIVPQAKVVPTQTAKPGSTQPMAKPIVRATPAPIPSKPRSSVPPPPPEVVDDEPTPSTPKKNKKKKKKAKLAGATVRIGGTEISRGMFFVLLALFLFCVTGITLIFMFVPFGKMFASAPEAQIVDVYTVINGMGYNNVGVRVMNSETAAYCIPGPRQIVVARPNPQGKFLLLRLKVPYSEIDRVFQGVRTRIYLTKEAIQVEANGVKKDVMFIQDDNMAAGEFQLSYQPPQQEGVRVSLRDYIGPKPPDRNWSHEGTLKEYDDTITFENKNGMQVVISVGSQRQDGGGGNILEHVTGKKILGNQQGLTGGVEGYIHVKWNEGSSGHIIYSDLEQPNEIGLNWNVNCICEIPAGARDEVNLIVLGKSRKLKIQ